MMRYVQSEQFQPQHSLDPYELSRLLSPTQPQPGGMTPLERDHEFGDEVDWQSEKITRRFDTYVWFSLNQGEWTQGDKIVVDREGVHTLFVKAHEGDPEPEVHKLGIDLSPPQVTLDISPLPEQEAGFFTATVDTIYTVKAVDHLSGVQSIEVATNGVDYSTYTEPFTLPPGRHVIKCRVTDHAGNKSTAITGEWITGTDTDSLEVNVLPAQPGE